MIDFSKFQDALVNAFFPLVVYWNIVFIVAGIAILILTLTLFIFREKGNRNY